MAAVLEHSVPTLRDVQGHWKRRWMERRGVMDPACHAHWFQAGSHFVDVRIPADQPLLANLADLASNDTGRVSALLAAKAFAGTISLSGTVCTWHRIMDWQGLSPDLDQGIVDLQPGGVLMESGLDGTYRECWDVQPGTGYRAYRHLGALVTLQIVSNQSEFAFGCVRVPDAKRQAARQNLLNGKFQSGWIDALMGDEYGVGKWVGDRGTIEHCTNPSRRGSAPLTRSASTLSFTLPHPGEPDQIIVLEEISP